MWLQNHDFEGVTHDSACKYAYLPSATQASPNTYTHLRGVDSRILAARALASCIASCPAAANTINDSAPAIRAANASSLQSECSAKHTCIGSFLCKCVSDLPFVVMVAHPAHKSSHCNLHFSSYTVAHVLCSTLASKTSRTQKPTCCCCPSSLPPATPRCMPSRLLHALRLGAWLVRT